MRLAWFSPLPPVHSGISAYSVDVLRGLMAELVPDPRSAIPDPRSAIRDPRSPIRDPRSPIPDPQSPIDLFVTDEVWRAAGGRLHAGDGAGFRPRPGPAGLPLYRAIDFPTLHDAVPYDLVVYQLGNAACHAYMWPYLLRWPGLVVLHDGALHHARAAALLRDDRADDYRAEFTYNHPGIDPRVADYVVAGLEGSPYYIWPMLRLVMERARGVVVHNRRLLEVLQEEFPDTPMAHVSMGVGTGAPVMSHDSWVMPGPSAEHQASGITFSAFGLITPEKRIPQVLQALADVRAAVPAVALRLVGETATHYALWRDIADAGVGDMVEVTGYVDDEQLGAEMAAADVCLCLRWPTAHETSASWLRCLAAGRPTVITDQLTTVDVPTLDPRHWQLRHTREDAASVFQPPPETTAVAVSIDMADEAHMLRQALLRLATDAGLREQLGAQALAWWQAHHTLPRMIRDYRRVLDWAVTLPEPAWPHGAPPHLRPDAAAHARQLIARLGVEVDVLR